MSENKKTYQVTRHHVRGSRIIREKVVGGLEYRESAEDHITCVIGALIGDTTEDVWYTADVERRR